MTTYLDPLATGSDYESLMRQVRSLSDRMDKLEGAPFWAREAEDPAEEGVCGLGAPIWESPSDKATGNWEEDEGWCGMGVTHPEETDLPIDPDAWLKSLHARFQEREATGAGPYVPPTPGLAAEAIQTISCGGIVHGAARLRSAYQTIIVSSGSMSEEQARVLEFYIETILADKPVGFRAFGPGRYAFLRVGRELYSSRDRLIIGGQTSRSVICSGHEFTDAQLRKFEEILDAVLGRQICTAYQVDP